MMRTLSWVVVVGGLALSVTGPAMAQRPEMTAPAWPSRYRGGTITPGEVTKVDQAHGTITVGTPSGERTLELGSSTTPGIAVGDRVDIQSIPAGRSPSAVGGAASDAPPLERVLPALPAAEPGAGLQYAPGAAPPGVELIIVPPGSLPPPASAPAPGRTP